MEASVLNFSDWAGYMFLISLRVLSTYIANPVFGKNMPKIAKIVLGIMISYFIISVIPITEPLVFGSVLEYAVACIKEIFLGVIFGMIMSIMTSCVYLSGHIIDSQLGFGFAKHYDPIMNSNADLSSSILNTLLVILFFVSNAHHIMIRMIKITFELVPPGNVTINANFVYIVIQTFLSSINIGLKIAMPIIAVSFVTEILLGVVIKSIPKMSFFIIGFPIKIIIGLSIMFIMLPTFSNISDTIFENMFTAIQSVFEEIGASV